MSGLNQLVKSIYGPKLIRKDNEGYIHHLYTLYQNKVTKENYFLRNIDLPSYLRTSEAFTELVIARYGNIISKMQIIPIDRNFQSHSYMLRAQSNIILLTVFLQIKKDCKEAIELDFFIRFLEFAINFYKIAEKNNLPLFQIGQIGITKTEQFTLCDPSLYFKSNEIIEVRQPFGEWMARLLRQFINLPLNQEQHQQALSDIFGKHLIAIRPLIESLLTGTASWEVTQARISATLNRNSDEITTVTSSFVDVNEMLDKSLKSIETKGKGKFQNMGKFGRMILIFVIITALVGAAYFCFQFFNRKINCEEGYFLAGSNQCLSCSQGCLRCSNQQPQACMKCSPNMYLVLEEQQDTQGFCLKECRGKLVNMGVCIVKKQKKVNQQNLLMSNNESDSLRGGSQINST